MVNCSYLEMETMHIFKIGFSFSNQTNILAEFIGDTTKVIFFKKISTFTFKDTGLDTQRFD